MDSIRLSIVCFFVVTNLLTLSSAQDLQPPLPPQLAGVDADANGIADALQLQIAAQDAAPESSVGVIICLTTPPCDTDLDLFARHGGTLRHTYSHALNGFSGALPLAEIPALRDALQASGRLIGICSDHVGHEQIDDAAQVTRIRPHVWDLGYDGNEDTTILILDTGVDDTHPDLASQLIPGAWQDFTPDNHAEPTDLWTHGSLVASIALGLGSPHTSGDEITTTKDGFLPTTSGSGFLTMIKIVPAPGAVQVTLDLDWVPPVGGGQAALNMKNPAWMWMGPHVYSPPRPLIESYWATEEGTYKPRFGNAGGLGDQPYSALVTYAYQSPGDGYPLFRGVAPGARLAAGKVLLDTGSGTVADFIAGLDWAVANRDVFNIRIINMSLSLANGQINVPFDTAVDNCAINGILFFSGAGNSYGTSTIASPATATYAFAVGGINDDGAMASFSANGAPGSTKPDFVAPCGSNVTGTLITGVDSNDGDARGEMADRLENDYRNARGNSLSGPHAGGLAALIIDAQEDNGVPYESTLDQVLRIKSLMIMTATETNQLGEKDWNNGMMPVADSGNDPPLDRGGHDNVEGYGQINGDAAIQAITDTLPVNGTLPLEFGSGPRGRRCHAMQLTPLEPGHTYALQVDGDPDLDCDLYVYSREPNALGVPVIHAASVNPNLGDSETISLTAAPGATDFYVVVKKVTGSGDVVLSVEELPSFIRGDANSDGVVNPLADALFLLTFGFLGGPPPPCDDAADVDDDGTINPLADGLFLLQFGFAGGGSPPPPFPDCGVDATEDDLGCVGPGCF